MLKKIDHIGIVVKDIDGAVKRYERGLGLRCTEREEIPDAGVRVAFFPIGDTYIELIQFTRVDPGVDERISMAEPGISHISFEVEDFDTALKDCLSKGFKLLKGFPRMGAHGRVAFLHPEDFEGALFEICEHLE